MSNYAAYTWYPSHAPVNIVFVQGSTFAGSGFPADRLDHAFVSESGATYAPGPQSLGKRIVEFVLDAAGNLVSRAAARSSSTSARAGARRSASRPAPTVSTSPTSTRTSAPRRPRSPARASSGSSGPASRTSRRRSPRPPSRRSPFSSATRRTFPRRRRGTGSSVTARRAKSMSLCTSTACEGTYDVRLTVDRRRGTGSRQKAELRDRRIGRAELPGRSQAPDHAPGRPAEVAGRPPYNWPDGDLRGRAGGPTPSPVVGRGRCGAPARRHRSDGPGAAQGGPGPGRRGQARRSDRTRPVRRDARAAARRRAAGRRGRDRGGDPRPGTATASRPERRSCGSRTPSSRRRRSTRAPRRCAWRRSGRAPRPSSPISPARRSTAARSSRRTGACSRPARSRARPPDADERALRQAEDNLRAARARLAGLDGPALAPRARRARRPTSSSAASPR